MRSSYIFWIDRGTLFGRIIFNENANNNAYRAVPQDTHDFGPIHRPFSYSEKESQSNDTLLHFVEFSNVHNSDRSSNATRSNLVYKNV